MTLPTLHFGYKLLINAKYLQAGITCIQINPKTNYHAKRKLQVQECKMVLEFDS